MSCIQQINIRIKNNCSEDNKIYSKMITTKQQDKDEEFLINEIFDSRIHIDVYFFKKNIITYIPRRWHSCSPIRRKENLPSYDNSKMKFDEWIKCNRETNNKIEKGIHKLFVEIFDRRYKLYPNNMCPLSSYALKAKRDVEMFIEKFDELSIYILFMIRNTFHSFFQYVIGLINFRELKSEEYDKIKEILYHIGQDIHKIFKPAFDNTDSFKMNSVLINLFEDFLIENHLLNKNKVRNVALYKERVKFDNYLKMIHSLSFRKYYHIFLKEKLFFEDIDTINTEKNMNDDDNNTNTKNKQNDESKENDNNNIEDLVNYINEPDEPAKKNKKKKKKKKKKNKGNNVEKEEEKTNETTNENNSNEDKFDLLFSNYKKAIEDFTQNIISPKKIKPKLSEAFLEYLNIISQ